MTRAYLSADDAPDLRDVVREEALLHAGRAHFVFVGDAQQVRQRFDAEEHQLLLDELQ